MATYIISDIHGNLDIFKKLLTTINFKFNEDSLYLLGDYVDWGPKSIETIKYIIDLKNKYNKIYPLIGNHDLMFLDQIKDFKQDQNNLDMNWLYNNRGVDTFNQFLKQPKKEQEIIEKFLEELPYRYEVKINNKMYLLAHACPVKEFIYDDSLSEEENIRTFKSFRFHAVWERIINKTNSPIIFYNKRNNTNYDNFICGHTISEYIKDEHLSIINKENKYIDIDCGAKIIGYKNFEYEKYARLSCLRLDDFIEFYER